MEKAELIRNFFFIKRDAKNSLCVGGNQEIIGGNQNRVSGTVENTEAYKSDSLHLLHAEPQTCASCETSVLNAEKRLAGRKSEHAQGIKLPS